MKTHTQSMVKSSIQPISVTNMFWWQWAYTLKWH